MKRSIIAVRMAPLTDSSFIVRKITDCPKVLCAAPSYLKRHGRPASLADLADHSCLVLRCANTSQAPWNFATREGKLSVPVSGRFEADDGDVLTRWALDGGGIAMKPLWEVADHLARGELVPVLPEFRPEPAVLALLYPHRATATSKLKAFADFMVSKGGGIWRDPSEDIPLAKVA